VELQIPMGMILFFLPLHLRVVEKGLEITTQLMAGMVDQAVVVVG
jgi:hypothetical protein